MRHLALTLVSSLLLTVQAAEGMWVPQQLPDIASELKKAGLEIDAKQLADLNGQPMGAIVSLGGCSASLVSAQGLVATNHHCAYGAIQLNSSPQRNLIRDGFTAAAFADELPAGPNARVFVLESITDVTAQVLAQVKPEMDGLARQKAIEAAQKAIVAAGEVEPGIFCRIYSFFGGLQYRLFKQLEIKDVRLVYAPPNSVGSFGGEVDNWMWPRHTGDFSLLRAYVGKDGKPAAYSPDNVPYQPKHWLKVASAPLKVGDYVMVAGYPGSTNRYALAAEFYNTSTWTYPTIGNHYKNVTELVLEAGKINPDIAIKYANTVRGWENTLKNFAGQLEGFARSHAGERKHQDEQAVLMWLAKRGEAGAQALDAHAKLLGLIERAKATRGRDLLLSQISNLGSVGAARGLYRLAIEQAKPDAERAPGYQQRDLPRIEGGLSELQKRFDPSMEKKLLTYWLSQYQKLPATERVAAVDAWIGGDIGGDISGDKTDALNRALDALYAGTQFGNPDQRLAWLKKDRAQFEASSDTIITFAVMVMPTLLKMEEDSNAAAGASSRYRPIYLSGVQDFRRSVGEHVYPDANASLRLTYGHVVGYQPRDGVQYFPFTTAEGMAAKATSEEPFNAPKDVLEAVKAKRYGAYADTALGTLPVNFLTDLDITGGNSGSAVMNGKGELVGLAFDGTWEGVSANWVYDGKVNRAIGVDIRYMLWFLDQINPAPRLLKELGINPSAQGK